MSQLYTCETLIWLTGFTKIEVPLWYIQIFIAIDSIWWVANDDVCTHTQILVVVVVVVVEVEVVVVVVEVVVAAAVVVKNGQLHQFNARNSIPKEPKWIYTWTCHPFRSSLAIHKGWMIPNLWYWKFPPFPSVLNRLWTKLVVFHGMMNQISKIW